mgnify:CR=1 FL=1
MQKIQNYINGELIAPLDNTYIDNYEPATGKVYSQIPNSKEEDVELAVKAAEAAFGEWSTCGIAERSRILLKISSLLKENLEEFAKAESIDNGKPVWLATQVDIPRASSNFHFFATAIEHFASESHYMEEVKAINFTTRKPIGVVGCISPWNLPLYLFSWKIAPALAAGNWEKLDSYLMPEHGLYLSLRPGAFDAVYHGESITNLMEYMPWYKGGIENFGCSPEQSDVPNFSCETAKMFSKQGCFLAPLKKYSRLSDMMANLNSYEVSDYSVSEIAKARKAEATAGYQLVHTREGLQIIFGKNAAGAWKLLVLDFSRFSCGA